MCGEGTFQTISKCCVEFWSSGMRWKSQPSFLPLLLEFCSSSKDCLRGTQGKDTSVTRASLVCLGTTWAGLELQPNKSSKKKEKKILNPCCHFSFFLFFKCVFGRQLLFLSCRKSLLLVNVFCISPRVSLLGRAVGGPGGAGSQGRWQEEEGLAKVTQQGCHWMSLLRHPTASTSTAM